MNEERLVDAKNKDLAASLTALRRASALARKIAIQTNTSIVVQRGNKIVHLDAAALGSPTINSPITS